MQEKKIQKIIDQDLEENPIYKKIEEWILENHGKNDIRLFCILTGIDKSIMSRLKNNPKKKLTIENAMRVANHTGIPLEYLGYPGIKLKGDGKDGTF